MTSSPSITFDQVQLNLGSFFQNFADQVLGTVQDVLAPIQPVIKILTTPIPVLSDLEGHDVTVVNLAQLFGNNGTAQFLSAITYLNNLIISLPKPGSGTDSGVWIDLGSFTIDGSAAKNPADANKLTPKTLSPASLAAINDEINKKGGPSGTAFTSGVSKLSSVQGGGISFPILSNPLDAFQVLLGNDGVTPPSLFELTLPTLTLGLKYTQTFRVPALPILAAQLSGQVGAQFSFAFGFDTKGLSEYRASTSKNIGLIFDGFYIVDPPDANQIVLTAGIAASAVIDAYFISGGVTGGVYATINFHLHNDSDDPQLRFSQFGSQLISDPLGIFDVSGDLTARLSAFVQIYYFFGSYRKDFELASVVLLTFNTNPQAGLARDTTSLGGSPASAVYGQPVTLTATVRPTSTSTTAPAPTGTVQFLDTTTNKVLGTSALSSSGVATLNVSGLTPGNHVIRASYLPSNAYRPTQETLTEVVAAASTTTVVGTGPPNPVYGQPLTFTATVAAAAPAAGPPSGTVQFYVDGSTVGSPVAVTTSNGATKAVFTLSTPLTPGPHAVTATFASGDATRFNGSSTTGPASVTIAAAGTVTAAAGGSPNPSVYGQPVSFRVTAAAPGVGVPTGVVRFTDATTGAVLGTADLVNGRATIPPAALTAGSHAITATYQGDGNFLPSSNAQPLQQTVAAATTHTAVSASASTLVEGNPLTFTAVVSAAAPSQLTPTGAVQFLVDGVDLGDPQPIDATGTATFTTSAVPLGRHAITAQFVDDLQQLPVQHRDARGRPDDHTQDHHDHRRADVLGESRQPVGSDRPFGHDPVPVAHRRDNPPGRWTSSTPRPTPTWARPRRSMGRPCWSRP